MTESERLVHEICTRSFLSLWSYANPRKTDGKELCDVLVVFDPHVVFFSVKAVAPTTSDNMDLVRRRWWRKAVLESISQLCGAERHLAQLTHVIDASGRKAIAFPPADRRIVHHVAVALGSGGSIPQSYVNAAKAFVHVFDERSLDSVMFELDTITDFTEYLVGKKALVVGGRQVHVRREEDLLAVYLHQGRKFPDGDQIRIEPGLWAALQVDSRFVARKDADRDSYVWDRLVEIVAQHARNNTLEFGDLREAEQVLRLMAGENRVARRALGAEFLKFLDLSRKHPACKLMHSVCRPDIAYLLLACSRDVERAERIEELEARSYAARAILPDGNTVVGIATEQADGGGFTIDVKLTELTHLTDEQTQLLDELRRVSGYFADSVAQQRHVDEWPIED